MHLHGHFENLSLFLTGMFGFFYCALPLLLAMEIGDRAGRSSYATLFSIWRR